MIKKGASGQAAIEYLLLLGAGVMLAALVVSILTIVLPWPQFEQSEDYYEESYHELDEISDPCLVGWWRFNDRPSGGCGIHSLTAEDISVYKNDALTDCTTWKNTDCVQGNCVEFMFGTCPGSCSKIPLIEVYNFTDFTIEVWVNSTSSTATQVILQRGDETSGNGSYGVKFNASGNVRAYYELDSSQTSINSPGIYADGRWHLVDVTRSGTTLSLYVDGAKVAEELAGQSGKLGRSDLEMRIGWDAAFDGSIDDLKLYRCALTEEKILGHCNRYASNVGVTCG
ncbi:MAG: LamG domain-containing protein [archaeon]